MIVRLYVELWSTTKWVSTVCGLLPTLLGIVVLLGWYTHNKTLIQVSPTFVPMQYNTALGFLVCGLGLLFAVRVSGKGTVAFGALAALIGVLTLIEYMFGVDLGIDQLLMEHYVTVATSNPGRMAPNTAVCFSLTGIALLLSANSQSYSRSIVAISVLGSLTFGLGVIAFAGYTMSLETAYGWGHLTRMAVHTSAGFIVLGVGLVAHAWDRTDMTMKSFPSWFSTVVGIVVLTFTLSLWQALNAVEAIGIAQYFVITFGIVLALALTVAVNLAGLSRRRALALEAAQHDLERIVNERTKELQESEENLRNLLESAPTGIGVVDQETNERIFVNRQLVELIGGQSAEQLTAADLADSYVNEEDVSEIRRVVGKGGTVRNKKVERRRVDGSTFWALQSSQLLGNFRGREARVVWMNDITDLVETEAAAGRLREAMETFSDSIVLYNKNEQVVFTNDKYHALFPNSPPKNEIIGYTQEQLLRLTLKTGSIDDPLAATDPEAWVAKLLKDRRTKHSHDGETTHADGRTMLYRHRPASDGGRIVVHTDITELKTKEQEVVAKETLLRMALDNMPGAMIVVDKNLDVVLVNDQYKEFYGDGDGLVAAGNSMRDILCKEIEKGLVSGDGNPDDILEARLNSFTSGETLNTRDTGINDQIIQVIRKPAPGGYSVAVATDITETVEAQRGARLLKEGLDTFSDMIILYDNEERVIFTNDRYHEIYPAAPPKAEITNYTMEDLLRRSLDSGLIDHPLAKIDPEAWLQQSLAARRDKDGSSGETTHKNGRTYFFRNSWTTEGGMIIVQIDITERKEAEQEIQVHRGRLDSILKNIQQAVVLFDRNKRLIEWNPRYPDALNIDESILTSGIELYDLALLLAKRGDYGDKDPHEIARERTESLWKEESRADLSFGDDRSFDAQSSRTPDGGMVITYTDISERKKAEEALVREKQIVDATLENMGQAITMFDENLNIIVHNSKYNEMYNFDPSVIENNRSVEYLHRYLAERGDFGPGDVEKLVRDRIDVISKFESYQFERQTLDGRYLEIRGNPALGGGFVTTYTDITERKNAERIIADAMHLIHESIQYASRIQRSVLPDPKVLANEFADFVAIWEPKDVVGGDIYLLRKCDGGMLLFVADCTGHGVPGAFMTMIATGALDQAIIEFPNGDPSALLQRTNQLVKTTLGQYEGAEGESDDGFECGLCLIDTHTGNLTYAGARFELWRVLDGQLDVVKGDRCGIGYRRTPLDQTFTDQTISYKTGAMFYLLSDGMVDQIGGSKRRAYGKRRIKSNLLDYYPMAMRKQAVHLLREFKDYQHKEERRDDVTLIGFVPQKLA